MCINVTLFYISYKKQFHNCAPYLEMFFTDTGSLMLNVHSLNVVTAYSDKKVFTSTIFVKIFHIASNIY